MLGLSEPFLSSAIDPSIYISTMLGSTSIPYQVGRFGSGHIAPSNAFVWGSSYQLRRPNDSIPLQRRGPRQVNIGGTNYIPFYSPSSSAPIPSNEFLVMYHPHSSHGSSGWSATSRHVVPSFTSTFALEVTYLFMCLRVNPSISLIIMAM